MKQIKETLNIISIPSRFYLDGNTLSFHDLLKESGYLEVSKNISEELLYEVLKSNSENFQSWLNWSEDKRTSEGWFLRTNGENFEVGHITDGNYENLTKFEDKLKACSFFIVKELDFIKGKL